MSETEHDGCDCTELCSMGPTCPGGMLAGLPGAGCWRTEDPRTHGLNHAPLPEGTLLDPGYCVGCDEERTTAPAPDDAEQAAVGGEARADGSTDRS